MRFGFSRPVEFKLVEHGAQFTYGSHVGERVDRTVAETRTLLQRLWQVSLRGPLDERCHEVVDLALHNHAPMLPVTRNKRVCNGDSRERGKHL